MRNAKAGPWIIGTVLVAVGVLALAWFFAIGPQLDQTAVARADTDAALAQNVVQAQRLETLEQQFAELDTYKAELAAIKAQIPEEDGLPALLRELDGAATAAGVTIIAVSPGTPVDFVGAAPVATTAAPAEATATEGEDAEETTTEGEVTTVPQEQGPVAVAGLVAVPIQVTVLGTFDATAAFLGSVQSGMQRLFLVTSYGMVGQDEAEASGGRPATAYGDVEMQVNGFVYVLRDAAAATATDTTTTGTVDS